MANICMDTVVFFAASDTQKDGFSRLKRLLRTVIRRKLRWIMQGSAGYLNRMAYPWTAFAFGVI